MVLDVPITQQEPRPQIAVGDPPCQRPCLLDHPAGRWIGGAASQVDAATAELDEGSRYRRWSQTVSPGDREEVGGQDLVGTLAEELPPAGPGSKRRPRHAMAAEDSTNGRVGAAHATAAPT